MSELLPMALQFILHLEHYTYINNYKKTIYSILLVESRILKKGRNVGRINIWLFFFLKWKAKLFHGNTQNISNCEGAL